MAEAAAGGVGRPRLEPIVLADRLTPPVASRDRKPLDEPSARGAATEGGDIVAGTRRSLVTLATGAALGLAGVSGMARAQAYPSRPARILVGFAAGGATDIQARLMGQWLSDHLGQQYIVDNRSGASGNIATEM